MVDFAEELNELAAGFMEQKDADEALLEEMTDRLGSKVDGYQYQSLWQWFEDHESLTPRQREWVEKIIERGW